MPVRIATFNVENLMARFDFAGWREAVKRGQSVALLKVTTKAERKMLEEARILAHEDDARQMTSLAIADAGADILCLQEIEDLKTLEAFEENYLFPMTGLTYPQKVWVEGNDSRGIDVAFMARDQTADGEKIEIRKVISHRAKTFGELGVHNERLEEMGFEANERVFRRDCLEVNVRIGGKPMTFFVCHFKSMGPFRNGMVGRDYTMPVRQAEALAVRNIIEAKFGSSRARKMRWMVCGDLNDYHERLVILGDKEKGYSFKLAREEISGVDPLLADGFCESLVSRRGDQDRWTLYYASGPSKSTRRPRARETHHLVQLDYLLASPALASVNERAVPDIIRAGQPHRAVFPGGQDVERYPRTGWDRPKASDHCPVAVALKIV